MFTYLLRRLGTMVVSFLIITAVLYGMLLTSPPEVRASLYMGRRVRVNMTAQQQANMTRAIINEYGLDDPYPVQYVRWLLRMARGDWGWSPTLRADVLSLLLQRTSATVELTLATLLMLAPAGLISGALAGWRRGGRFDRAFRGGAYLATSVPPFILGLVLLALFYVGLRWFPPGRLSFSLENTVFSPAFKTYTGLLVVDGALNGRFDVTLDALRHLALPAFTLGLAHWATLGRITRATILDEVDKEYIIAAKARGLPDRALLWRHTFPNVGPSALTSVGLSAASLVTGVYIIERVFNYPGVSKLAVTSMSVVPDVPLAMGFALYSVILVLAVLLVLDLAHIALNPRVRREILD